MLKKRFKIVLYESLERPPRLAERLKLFLLSPFLTFPEYFLLFSSQFGGSSMSRCIFSALTLLTSLQSWRRRHNFPGINLSLGGRIGLKMLSFPKAQSGKLLLTVAPAPQIHPGKRVWALGSGGGGGLPGGPAPLLGWQGQPTVPLSLRTGC